MPHLLLGRGATRAVALVIFARRKRHVGGCPGADLTSERSNPSWRAIELPLARDSKLLLSVLAVIAKEDRHSRFVDTSGSHPIDELIE